MRLGTQLPDEKLEPEDGPKHTRQYVLLKIVNSRRGDLTHRKLLGLDMTQSVRRS